MLKDLRYAIRGLRKNPGFGAVAVCSLALGIGATSAIYSRANAWLLRPLPVPKTNRVVAVNPITDQTFAGFNSISYPAYKDFRDRNRTFEGLVASGYSFYGFAPDATTLPHMKFGIFVSGNFFEVLGVRPAVGRLFRRDEDDVIGRDPVVVLSHDFWAGEYGAKGSVIGEKLRLNGIKFTIIGVAPESFTGTDQFLNPALYVPFAMSPRLANVNSLDQRQVRWLKVLGRLKPGAGIAQAQADLSAIASVLRNTYPQTDGNLRVKVESQLQAQAEFSPPTTAMVVMLALCVLLVACANVAGLLLSRASRRTREFGVRLAIGAGRAVLVRQLLIENLMLAIAGGAAGLVVAYAGVALFNTVPPPPSDLPLKSYTALDSRVMLFTASVSILSTLLFGLVPALRSTRLDLVPALKATDTAGSKRARLWGRHLLVGAQIALSLVLLVVSGVLIEGFRAQLTQGPGFRTDHLFLMRFDPSLLHYNEAQNELFYKRLLDQTRLASDVKSAALASVVPMTISGGTLPVVPEGYRLKRGQEAIDVFSSVASDSYFETMGIPIVEGRSFLESDKQNTRPVAVVNEPFAHHYWPNQNALGKRFRLRNSAGKLVEIVGVARSTKLLWLTESPLDCVYLPFSQNPQFQMSLVVQSISPEATTLAPVLQHVVQAIDRNMPVFDARSMKDVYENRAVKAPNLIVEIVAALGAMGLILAAVGLYGVVAYSVSRRTREFGIRMAIGADRRQILRMILQQGLTLGVAGVAAGLVIGVLASRSIKSIMFFSFGHVARLPFLAVSVLLILTTVAAAYLPARRAARIEPVQALREE